MTPPSAPALSSRTPKATVGRWWRFDRYSIRDGLIRPDRRSTLQFIDPWEEYEKARASTKAANQVPYQSLLDLLMEVDPRPGSTGHRFTFGPDANTAIENWCSQHGLLGLLEQRMLMMAYRPRWAAPPEADSSSPFAVATQRGFVAECNGWFPYRSIDRNRRRAREGPPSREHFLEPGNVPADWPDAGILIRHLDAPKWQWEPFSTTFARHFPDLAGDHPDEVDYPPPLSKAFCENYCEPVNEFLSAAIRLRDILHTLGLRTPMEPRKTSTERDREIAGALARLHNITQTVSPVLQPLPDGSYRRYTAAPSLIASYAYMMLQDLADPKHRVLRCATCEKIFLSTAYQTVHCSRTCQRTAHKRRKRMRERESREATHRSTSPRGRKKNVKTRT